MSGRSGYQIAYWKAVDVLAEWLHRRTLLSRAESRRTATLVLAAAMSEKQRDRFREERKQKTT